MLKSVTLFWNYDILVTWMIGSIIIDGMHPCMQLEEIMKIKLKEGYLLKEVAGEAVLFPVGQNVVDDNNIFVVNATGRFIVEKLQDEIIYKDLLKDVLEHCEAVTEKEIEQVQFDLDRFLDELWRRSMLCA